MARATHPDEVSAVIRDRIIRRRYAPGERLTEEGLAEDFGISRIPVREALRLLSAEGFVRVQPHWGTFVAELTPEEADDLVEIRSVLEPLAARRAAVRRTAAQLDELRTVVRDGRAAGREGRVDDAGELNGRFHELIAAASGSRALAAFIGQLRAKIDWAYSVERHPRARSWADHAAIVAAIADGDADRAAETVRAHVARTASAYRFRGGAGRAG